MKRKRISRQIAFFSILLFIMFPGMCFASDMGDINLDVEISTTPLRERSQNVTYNSIENEFLVVWRAKGPREEGGEDMWSIHGQRVSPDGSLLGEQLSIGSSGPEERLFPKAAYNPFTNQYMVSFIISQEVTGWDPFVAIIASDGSTIREPYPISENPVNAGHPSIVFNSTRRQYLVVYNDSRTGVESVYGVILDEDGNIVKEDFAIKATENTAEGGYIHAFPCYNPTDDTYLVNWEDFRHVSNWITDPSDIYGALLDGEGNILVNDIPMIDDYGMDDTGGQGVQNIAYNPDRNEFLVSWTDRRSSLSVFGIVGRIIKSDGTLAGEEFVLVDASESQYYPYVVYVETRKMYFAVWSDSRIEDPNDETEADIYAKWLSPLGESIGSDFPICSEERKQWFPKVAYNPVMDRLLIAWWDMVDERVSKKGGFGHIPDTGGNIMGKIYGVPSFLTCRVVEKGAGTPVEGVQGLVLGPCFPVLEETNIGGWFNIAESSQLRGIYLVIVFKPGYQMAIEFVNYIGEPQQVTIEMVKW